MTDENEIKWTAGSNPAFRSDANSSPTPGARHARVLAPHSRSRAGRTSSRNGRACPVTPFLLNTGARALRPAATVDSPVRATLSTAGARAGDVDSGRVGESQSRARTTFYLTWPETSDAQHGRDGEGGSGHVVPTCSTESERSGWAGQSIPFHGLLDSPASPRAPLAHAGAPVEPLLPARSRSDAGRARSLTTRAATCRCGIVRERHAVASLPGHGGGAAVFSIGRAAR